MLMYKQPCCGSVEASSHKHFIIAACGIFLISVVVSFCAIWFLLHYLFLVSPSVPYLVMTLSFSLRIHFANNFYPYCGKDGSSTDQGTASLPSLFLDFLSFLSTLLSSTIPVYLHNYSKIFLMITYCTSVHVI